MKNLLVVVAGRHPYGLIVDRIKHKRISVVSIQVTVSRRCGARQQPIRNIKIFICKTFTAASKLIKLLNKNKRKKKILLILNINILIQFDAFFMRYCNRYFRVLPFLRLFFVSFLVVFSCLFRNERGKKSMSFTLYKLNINLYLYFFS